AYVKRCRIDQTRATEAQKIYDFASEPSSTTSTDLDSFIRHIPMKNKKGASSLVLSWTEWVIPNENQSDVFVTITKLDTQTTWQGYRSLQHMTSTGTLFQGDLSTDLVKNLIKDMNWPELQVLQDWDILGTNMDCLKAILQKFQVTVTSCHDDGVVVSTGGFDSMSSVFGGATRAQLHERHPASPTEDSVTGTENGLTVNLQVVNGRLLLELRRQIERETSSTP
ncbi:MAG: hypothetical protein SGILL_004051, partial [Bacillariaceae sp.]